MRVFGQHSRSAGIPVRVAVVGSGVSGLTCAIELSGVHEVGVFAENAWMDTTSAIATAIWHLYLVDPSDARITRWATTTLKHLLAMCAQPDAGVYTVRGFELFRRTVVTIPSWSTLVPFFRLLAPSDLGEWPGVISGYEVEAPLAEMTYYLPYLL